MPVARPAFMRRSHAVLLVILTACGGSSLGTDPGGRDGHADPVVPVDAAPQRDALRLGDAATGADAPRDLDSSPAWDAAAAGDSAIVGDAAPVVTVDAEVPASADAAPPVLPTTHPRIYLNEGNRARLRAALDQGRRKATRFRDLVDGQLQDGNRYDFQAWYAALLFQLLGEERYGRYAVDTMDDWVTAEEARIAARQNAAVAYDSYLEVGDHIGNVSLVYDWCFDLLTAQQKTRWLAYANQAVWNVWHPDDARWGGASHPWSGWSIDNPSNNYYYSFLRATMLLGLASRGENSQADGWITMFRDTKIAHQLVPTFARDLPGGGSREGSGYGTAMMRLFELYDLWEASTGERLCDLTPHAKASLVHFLHLVVPTLDRLAPVGDHSRDSTAELFDYHRHYVQILTYLYRRDPIAPYGKWFLNHSAVREMQNGFMLVYDFLYDEPSVTEASSLGGLYPAYVGSGTGQIYVRSSWDRDATWLHFVAGPYSESHAHRDQGSFLLYKNEWLAYDANVDSHSGIRLEEDFHNLVRLASNGETAPLMREGTPFARLVALSDTPDYFHAAADVTPVYRDGPTVDRLERELVYLKPNVVVVLDRVEAETGLQRLWQVNSPLSPTVSGQRATFSGLMSDLEVTRIHPTSNVTTSSDDWPGMGWPDDTMYGGYRFQTAHEPAGASSRFLHVMALDHSVASAQRDDDGTRLGVAIDFTDGTSAVVRFETDRVGGSLELRDGSGRILVSDTLTAAVAALPVYAR